MEETLQKCVDKQRPKKKVRKKGRAVDQVGDARLADALTNRVLYIYLGNQARFWNSKISLA